MFMKNEDIQLLIKIENIIGMKEKAIFGRNKQKTIKVADDVILTFEDFIDYINLVERAITDKKKLAEKSNKWNKDHQEKHRKYNREYARKHK